MNTHIVELDKDIEELVPAFLNSRHSDLERLQAALQAAEWPHIVRTGHNIKGGAGSFGFVGLAQIGSRLEEAAKNQDQATTQACLEEIRDYLAGLQIRYI